MRIPKVLSVVCVVGLGLWLTSLPTHAQVATCIAADAAETQFSTIQASYEERIAAVTKRTQEESARIAEEAPDPNAVEAMVDIQIDVSSHDEEIILHLPEVTMKDQTLSLDLPQVTMVDQEWIFHTPSIRMVMSCTPGLPETVCEWKTRDVGFGIKTDILECYTRAGDDICLEIPEPFMEEQRIVLGVPEVTMATTEFVMGVPEIAMKEQRIVITLPDFTVRQVSAEIAETKEISQELAARAGAETSTLSTQMKADLSQASVERIKSTFACQIDALELQRVAALAMIDTNVSAVTGALEAARQAGATQIAESTENSLAALIAGRDHAQKKFDLARDQLTAAMDEALIKASDAGLRVAVSPPN